jgi:hypothetical protein
VQAARQAYLDLAGLTLSHRQKMIDAIRRVMDEKRALASWPCRNPLSASTTRSSEPAGHLEDAGDRGPRHPRPQRRPLPHTDARALAGVIGAITRQSGAHDRL